MSYDPPRPYRPHLVSPTASPTSPSTLNSVPESSHQSRLPPHPQSYDSLQAPPSITTWSDASISSLDQSKERLPPPMTAAQQHAPQAPLPPLPRGSGGRPSTLQKQPPPSSAAASGRGPPPPRPPPLLLPGQVAPQPQMMPPQPRQQQQHVVQEKPDMYSVKMGG